MEGLGARGWMQAQERARDAPAARDHRGGGEAPAGVAGASRSPADRLPRRMSSPLRKLLLAVLAARSRSLALGACGDSHTRVTTGTYAGESGANAPYLNVGPLVYEVQLSRELNPYQHEDAAYLRGSDARPSASSNRARSGSGCSCRSTTTPRQPHAGRDQPDDHRHPGQHLHPDRARARPTSSPTAAGPVPAKSQLPSPSSVAADGPTAGRAAALQDPDRLARQPAAGAEDRRSRTTPPRTASAELDV